MKKRIILPIAAIMMIGLLLPSLSQAAPAKAGKPYANIVRGTITSIDTAKNQITVKDRYGADKTITATAKDISSLKTGDRVRVTLQSGTNTAQSIVKQQPNPGRMRKK